MRTALFADISNLYYCVGKKYEGRKLDYQKLLDFAKDLSYGEVQRAFAYGAQVRDEAINFITCLKKIGYDTKYREAKLDEGGKGTYRKADWEVGIAIDAVTMCERVDAIILASSNPVFAPLAQWARGKGVRVIVLACGINRELKDVSDQWIEIGESLLEDTRNEHAA